MSEKLIKRRESLVSLVQERKAMTVEGLADALQVSAQTVRRDINYLCDRNILRRRHGWAEPFEQDLNTPYDERNALNTQAKQAIARETARLVEDGTTVFLSIGTTPAMVAKALQGRRGLTVVTNNLNAAMALSNEASNRIILPGGELRLPDRDILGDSVADLFRQYRADYGIFGVAGIAEDGGMLDFHASEVRVREVIRQNCRRSVLVLDSSKFGRSAPAIGGNIHEVDQIVLDRKPGAEFAEILAQEPDRVVLAGGAI